MLSVPPTTLEQFRLLMEKEYIVESEFINEIRTGKFVENERMKIGTAWHKVLEHPDSTRYSKVIPATKKQESMEKFFNRSGEYYFDADIVDSACKMIGPGFKETKFVKTIATQFGDVRMAGKCDWVNGLLIQDTKTKIESQAKAEDYEDSLQWRTYLWLTGCREFRYNLFPTYAVEADGYVPMKDPEQWLSFSFFTYDGILQDIKQWLGEFLSWAYYHALLPALEYKAR